MNSASISMGKQFKNNILAILSLTIAISALGYNSWRNEQSEQNRNIRQAGFEIIKETAKLQHFLDNATFITTKDQSNTPIEGWVRIRLIQSLSMFMNEAVQIKANFLLLFWKDNWQNLKLEQNTNNDLSIIIDGMVKEVRVELSQLN
ncbi:MAG: hypothetical protein COA86_01840 [Kangiella sp.]|nr:MAG: hypothetical protein COA86_01840 [Kangiella sp.]